MNEQLALKRWTWAAGAAALIICGLVLAGCGVGAGGSSADPYADRSPVDLSGYESMADYDGEVRLVPTTAAEAARLMRQGKSFVLFAGYEECGYCNLLLPYLNEAAIEADRYVGYIDTRANPDWMTNNDIDDFDRFLDCFGNYLEEDENGEKHLYTPDTYFVKDGQVAARHDGVVEGVDETDQPLGEGQEDALREQLAEAFQALE